MSSISLLFVVNTVLGLHILPVILKAFDTGVELSLLLQCVFWEPVPVALY